MQWVYKFGKKNSDGNVHMKQLLGGKGANLAEMSKIGINVPPGFTVTTVACAEYYKNSKTLPHVIQSEILEGVKYIENTLGLKLGGEKNPLLISVRSGAPVSMPGMMDTILNLGLNDNTVAALATKTKNPRFAYDSYRRFIQMYSEVVLGLEHYEFEKILDYHKRKAQASQDSDLDTETLLNVVSAYKKLVLERSLKPFPEDVLEQLSGATGAVFASWNSGRAAQYRAIHDIPADLGTAINIQAMVFGNLDNNSATGVMFTRNPATGEQNIFGEFLVNAQGEDIVSGVRTPQPINILGKKDFCRDVISLEESMPDLYRDILEVAAKLESHYRDMQDIEFTIESGRLWILQTRSAKRTANAEVKIAVDMVAEGLLSKQEALNRISSKNIEQLIHPTIDPNSSHTVIAKGLPASPGAASGIISFSSKRTEELSKQHKVILVRHETSPEDISGMSVSAGILTVRGGMTSHAAVVARSMGKPCVCGAFQLFVSPEQKILEVGEIKLTEGDWITINGMTGEVILGEAATIMEGESTAYRELRRWIDETRRLGVRANAETVKDTKIAEGFGAEGIGLCRTEHMFFNADRIFLVRQMILAKSKEERLLALKKLLSYQQEDFLGLFQVMKQKPITIRLLDPPLHEFLPLNEEELMKFVKAGNYQISQVRSQIEALKEVNPMLGHRGCRLAVTYPEIYSTQVVAILMAAHEMYLSTKLTVIPEIMVPFVMDAKELAFIKQLVYDTTKSLELKWGRPVKFLFGTMIELPRAALHADKIAPLVDFLSFGTNDLTQTTMGLSRDDSARFISSYIENGIIKCDPFISLDQSGVGELVKIAVTKARQTNPKIKLGLCGEHGGDQDSIIFCHNIGLDYVSCSPYRIAIAKLAAAKAALIYEN